MRLKKAELKSFNSTTYKATVRLAGSYKAYLEDVTVAKNMPAAEITTDRKVAVLFLEEYSSKEAVVIAVY